MLDGGLRVDVDEQRIDLNEFTGPGGFQSLGQAAGVTLGADQAKASAARLAPQDGHGENDTPPDQPAQDAPDGRDGDGDAIATEQYGDLALSPIGYARGDARPPRSRGWSTVACGFAWAVAIGVRSAAASGTGWRARRRRRGRPARRSGLERGPRASAAGRPDTLRTEGQKPSLGVSGCWLVSQPQPPNPQSLSRGAASHICPVPDGFRGATNALSITIRSTLEAVLAHGTYHPASWGRAA